jgi:hypothetical protein
MQSRGITFLRLGRILFAGWGIKSTGSREEGTVPFRQYRPCTESDGDVVPIKEVSHIGGAQSGGGEYPGSIHVFFNISYENRSIQIGCGDYYPTIQQVR